MFLNNLQMRKLINESPGISHNIGKLNRKDYEQWASDKGHITAGAVSVLASYVIDMGLESEFIESNELAMEMGMEPVDLGREIDRQLEELGASYSSPDDASNTLSDRGHEEIPDHTIREGTDDNEEEGYEVPESFELDVIEDVWGGDLEAEDKNLVLSIDHSKAAGGEEVTNSPESEESASPVLNKESFGIQVYTSSNDIGISCVLPESLQVSYYGAYILGHSKKAQMIIEEHLDKAFPVWKDYEWTTIKLEKK